MVNAPSRSTGTDRPAETTHPEPGDGSRPSPTFRATFAPERVDRVTGAPDEPVSIDILVDGVLASLRPRTDEG
jgi:hypothetical protein